MSDYRQSKEYCQYFANLGWRVVEVVGTRVLIRKIPLLGSIIKIQRCQANIPFTRIDKLAKHYHALFVIIEASVTTEDPDYQKLDAEFKNRNYRNLKFAMCPTKTSYIDLTKSEAKIMAGFDANIRKRLKKNQADGVTTKTISSLTELYLLLAETGKRRHFFVQAESDWLSQWGSFGRQAQVIVAFKGDQLLGGNMSLLTKPTAFGLFLPTTEAGRQAQVTPTLLWEGLRHAKQAGCTTFDLEGLYDNRYKAPKKWQGLTAFKRKFRGHEVEFIPTQIKFYAWYLKPLGCLVF